jgi:hypothetical protein
MVSVAVGCAVSVIVKVLDGDGEDVMVHVGVSAGAVRDSVGAGVPVGEAVGGSAVAVFSSVGVVESVRVGVGVSVSVSTGGG